MENPILRRREESGQQIRESHLSVVKGVISGFETNFKDKFLDELPDSVKKISNTLNEFKQTIENRQESTGLTELESKIKKIIEDVKEDYSLEEDQKNFVIDSLNKILRSIESYNKF